MLPYQEFLQSKIVSAKPAGFEVAPEDLNTQLFDFQAAIVQWALKLGRAAIFTRCGSGKTAMMLEWANWITKLTGGRVLLLTPLAVAQQTVLEGHKFGISTCYVRSKAEAEIATESILVSNYEMLKNLNPAAFVGVVCDESGILKNYSGSTKRRIVEAFADTPYKLSCSATPAPNDHLELGNQAEFLGVMDSHDMICRWFINDTMQAGGYRLKRHGQKDFWRWVASWAVCISSPSDLGFSDDGWHLPPLELKNHVVAVDHSSTWDSGQLIRTDALSATKIHQELRLTAPLRAAKAAELVRPSEEPWIIWVNTNYEAEEIKALLPTAVEVRGSDPLKVKEERLLAFSRGEIQVLLTKPSISGHGLNWQHCRQMVFVGLSYSFEQFHQAVHRSWRFGQTQPVTAHIVSADTEGAVLQTIRTKQEQFELMQREMSKAMAEVNFGHGTGSLQASLGYEPEIAQGQGWELRLGDCVEVCRELEADSVHLTVSSLPFSNLYTYSASLHDMGNTEDDAHFFEHFDYLIPELLRVTVPGRLCVMHCKDLPLYKGRDGAAGLRDFPGEIIRRFESHGWVYHSRVTIWKDPVIEMQRTKNHGLLHKNFAAAAENCRQGMADYLVVFRKWDEEGTSPVPVIHQLNAQQHQFKGSDRPEYWEDDRHYSISVWQRYASPVWMDIQQTNVLNVKQAKEGADEKHTCPLQLQVIERCIDLWTNPGETVFDPFAGIGSTPYAAVQMGRRALGIELKRSYFEVATKNLKLAAGDTHKQISLLEALA